MLNDQLSARYTVHFTHDLCPNMPFMLHELNCEVLCHDVAILLIPISYACMVPISGRLKFVLN